MATGAEQIMLEQIAQGNHLAFSQLVDQYGPRVYGLAFRLSRNVQMAEDVVQEVFTQIWQTREALPEVKNINGFLLTIARNYMVNVLKKIMRERYHLGRWQETTGAEDQPDQLTGIVDEALETLSPQQRKVWVMHRREKMKYEEIAKQLGISRDAVNKYLQTANKKLIEYLKAREHLLEIMLIGLTIKNFF